MALNANHIFEDLGDVKCSVVEKNCSSERADFLKKLLELNHFTVVIVKSPIPKTAAKPAATEGEVIVPPTEQTGPETFTVGVTDLSFNVSNAVYNRELKCADGRVVMPKFWRQQEAISKENDWYWQ